MDDISTSVLAMASKVSSSASSAPNKHAQGSFAMMRKLRNNGVHVVIANKMSKSDDQGSKQIKQLVNF